MQAKNRNDYRVRPSPGLLVCLYRDPLARLRDIAVRAGITERAVQRIVADLEEAGVITRRRTGRRNLYGFHPAVIFGTP